MGPFGVESGPGRAPWAPLGRDLARKGPLGPLWGGIWPETCLPGAATTCLPAAAATPCLPAAAAAATTCLPETATTTARLRRAGGASRRLCCCCLRQACCCCSSCSRQAWCCCSRQACCCCTRQEVSELIMAKKILKCQICPFRVVVAPYGPILRECEATASLKPLACLLVPETAPNRLGRDFREIPLFSPLGP